MRKRFLTIVLTALLLFSLTSCNSEEPMMSQMSVSSETVSRPGPEEDYYGYINYDFLTTNQIPYNKTGISTSETVMEVMENYLSDMIDKYVSGTPQKGSLEEMIKETYLQYMDLEAREKTGVDPLRPALGMIESCKTVDELISAMGMIYQQYGVSSFFRFIVEPETKDNSKNALFMMNMFTCGNMKENFTKTDAGINDIGSRTENVLKALNVDKAEANARAKNVVRLIYDIMLETADSDCFNDWGVHYNPRTKEECKDLLSNIDVDNLLTSFGFNTDSLIVFDVPQAEMINKKLKNENLRAMQDYMLSCLAFEYADTLPPGFMGGLSKAKADDTDKHAKQYTAALLDEEIGQLYGREICTDEVMSAVEIMVRDIQGSLRELINDCDRLSKNSKEKFLLKLDNMIINLGYNKDYVSPFTITSTEDGGSLLSNAIAVKSGKVKAEISTLNEKASRGHWNMTPITVNAVYNPTVNCITIPAVNMAEPAFSLKKSKYYNLGYFGYIVAHEMNHAFDSNGFLYDDTGCYKPGWINEEDSEAYKKVMEKITDYYNHYLIMDVYSINGKQTLGENIADLGAVQCILNLSDDKTELEEIFTGIAESWAELIRIQDVTQALEGDVHSPAEARVNAVVSVMDKFYLVYDVKEKDKMYVAPENRVRIW